MTARLALGWLAVLASGAGVRVGRGALRAPRTAMRADIEYKIRVWGRIAVHAALT